MKHLITLVLVISLSACGTFGNGGSTVSVQGASAVSMSGEAYARMKMAEADAMANAEYYRAEAMKYQSVTDPTAQLGLAAIDALNANKRLPTNSNDVAIVAEQQKSARTATRWGTAGNLLKTTITGATVLGGMSLVKDLGEAALNSSGTTINADNGSTVTGAIGEGNTYSTEIGGIPLNSADVDDIALGSNEEVVEEEPEVCDIRDFIPSADDPLVDVGGAIDENGDGLVCSDGMGGSVDN